ncbi:MAG: acetate--CoA ligase family protein, partial [Alphaproteobacteria bacterium]|nr:acetate--CoA ligase family protein [Alphaproteobacteria bacterium]
MSEHRLRPLLAPKSIAVVGASGREGSFGLSTLQNLNNPGFDGPVHPINPGYDEIDGLACFPSLRDVPGGVEHAVLSVANAGVEAALTEAAEAGVRAVTMFGSAYLEGDTGEPKLRDRLQAIAREADMLVCGANCMGFVNYESSTRATWMAIDKDDWDDPGNITLITHSGTCFLTLQFNDPRHRHNMCISAGQELTVTAADYMDYALEQESTRAIALFLETVRDPDAFRAVLDKAVERDVPVVAIKVGVTEKSAELAQSHSGALAGQDAAYEALFDHYGVLRVDNWDDLAATSRVLSDARKLSPGGLAGIMDSGGARGMLIDMADKMGVPLADIGPQTVKKLAGLLEYGLEPVNPTDVWGTGLDWENVFGGCMQALADDEDAAFTAIFSDLGFTDEVGWGLVGIAEGVAANTDKPVYLCQHWSRAMNSIGVQQSVDTPVVVIDGTQTFLTAVRLAMQRRDRIDDGPGDMPALPSQAVVDQWRARLGTGEPFDENEGLDLLDAFGMTTPGRAIASSRDEALTAAEAVGYPVVLKTALAGIQHKSDVGGVVLNLANGEALAAAYGTMAAELGPRVLIAAMAGKGVELAAGIVIDSQFGPLVMVAAGGVLIEIMHDRRFLLPPAGRASARRA